MSQKMAQTFQENSLKVESIPFAEIPHQSKLFLDFQADLPEIAKFYPEKNTDLKEFAEKVLVNYKTDRNTLCDALAETNKSFGTGKKTFENIELLREKDCLAIVTGQQAGLFSGSLYTIYKALSAVKMCEDLRRQNIKAVPVFWIAEEDHDFDEVKKTYILSEQPGLAGCLASIENAPRTYQENSAVGFIKLDETIIETIENLNLPQTDFTENIKNNIKETYKSGETFSTAFAKFLGHIFADYGLIFLSPLDEKLKKLSAPIFSEAVEKSEEIASALLRRNDELKDYSAQVLVEENFFPFFYQDETRQAMRRDLQSGNVKIQKSKTEFTNNELKEIAENLPKTLSPNALMRPIVQDFLLPTLTYFGGGAEIAYFAQNAVIYEILNRPVTPIRHRASFTIVEPKNRRTL
ncbi:MAG TPA: bacillithiol biosynthesis cysteine-adding enzyme BshC, partial [Pyrinomonadaceae bacterium]|nr:bacillithiol biosynthesis cysteine-adding enzyme BshC [Pyrinomonadaceae bacterium]